MLGVQISQDPPASNPKACEFTVHLYLPTNPGEKGKRVVRVRSTATILFDSGEEFADNFQSASEWKTAIHLQIHRAVKATFGDPSIQEVEEDSGESF